MGGRRRARAAILAVSGEPPMNGAHTPLPPTLLQQRAWRYDANTYPFAELVAGALGVAASELCRLHETAEGRRGGPRTLKSGRDPFSRRWASFMNEPSAERHRLHVLLHAFVAAEVANALGGAWHVVYQRNRRFACTCPTRAHSECRTPTRSTFTSRRR